jgi:PAS domain S-box-containing protein
MNPAESQLLSYNRSLIEASLDPLVTIGSDGKITDVNKATEIITGRVRQELIGTDFADYFTDAEKARAGYRQAFAKGNVRDYELYVRHADGHTTPVHYNATMYRDDTGRVAGVFAAARDVTERKNSEAALIKNSWLLEEAGRLAKFGGWELDLLKNELIWSNVIKQLHEVGPDYQPTVEAGIHFYAPEAVPVISEALKRAIEEGTSFDVELRLITAKQNRIWVRVIGRAFFDNGKVTKIEGAFQDISARKAIEVGLEKTREELEIVKKFADAAAEFAESVINTVREPLISLDQDLRVVTVGRSFYDFFKVKPEETVGQLIYDLGDKQWDIPKLRELLETILPQKATFDNYEVEHDFAGIGRRTMLLNARQIEQVLGKKRTILLAIEDITERKAIEAGLEQTRKDLESSNKELEAFTYSVSHDLRAPLRAVAGFSRILIDEHAAQLSPDVQRYLNLVLSNTLQMGRLVDDLLSFSRFSRQAMADGLIDPAQLVREAMDLLCGEQPDRALKLTVADLPPCRGDRTLLKQIFVNLLSNALKFTRQRDPAVIEVGFSRKDGETIYFVRDNGAGFDMRYVGKLFGVFQRLHSSESYEGTGVGLAIVQRIVHRHGGRVWAEGEPDKGATFYFTLGGMRS